MTAIAAAGPQVDGAPGGGMVVAGWIIPLRLMTAETSETRQTGRPGRRGPILPENAVPVDESRDPSERRRRSVDWADAPDAGAAPVEAILTGFEVSGETVSQTDHGNPTAARGILAPVRELSASPSALLLRTGAIQ
jgi:hypothetical protein